MSDSAESSPPQDNTWEQMGIRFSQFRIGEQEVQKKAETVLEAELAVTKAPEGNRSAAITTLQNVIESVPYDEKKAIFDRVRTLEQSRNIESVLAPMVIEDSAVFKEIVKIKPAYQAQRILEHEKAVRENWNNPPALQEAISTLSDEVTNLWTADVVPVLKMVEDADRKDSKEPLVEARGEFTHMGILSLALANKNERNNLLVAFPEAEEEAKKFGLALTNHTEDRDQLTKAIMNTGSNRNCTTFVQLVVDNVQGESKEKNQLWHDLADDSCTRFHENDAPKNTTAG